MAAQGEGEPKSLEEGMAEAEKYEGDPLDCPCIQHMKEGPCGDKFVVAYRCFLDSKEEERGSDCLESFKAMQMCFAEHPEHYKEFLGDDEEEDEDEEEEEKEGEGAAKENETKTASKPPTQEQKATDDKK